MDTRREGKKQVTNKEKKMLVYFGPHTEAQIDAIVRYYFDTDGHTISKSEAIRRSIFILANEINKKNTKKKEN